MAQTSEQDEWQPPGPVPGEEPTPKAPPALFDHCRNTYEAMLREATQVKEGVGNGMIVYEGFFTQLISGKLNLSVPYYTSITKALVDMGCIRQLKRGGGTSPSQWELITQPTLDLFYNSRSKKSRKPSKETMLQEQIDNLIARVGALELSHDTILEALAQQFGTSKVEAEADG